MSLSFAWGDCIELIHQCFGCVESGVRSRNRAGALGRVREPRRLEAPPTAQHHRIGGGVRVRALAQLLRQQLCRSLRQWRLDALAVLKNALGMLGIEDRFQMLTRRRRSRSAVLTFLRFYLCS